MRILHTSDWHLGRTFHGIDLIDAQRSFVAHLAEVVRAEDIDAVLIAGDVYDRAIPSLEAVEVLETGLAQMARDAAVVISSGNHDGARRLGFASALLENANVHLRTRLSDVTRPIRLGAPGDEVSIYAVPYLEPFSSAGHLPAEAGGSVRRTHEGVLSAAMRQITEHRRSAPAGKTILMSHAWYAGGESSDSEIDISLGGIGKVSTSLLAPFDYAALGHLHKPQAIDHHQRYCGSPLHYSFSEMGSQKMSLIVDLSGHQPCVTEVPVPVFRSLHEIADSMDALLTSTTYTKFEASFLRIYLSDLPVPEQAANRLRARFPYLVDLRVRAIDRGQELDASHLRTLSPIDICNMFLRDDRGTEADDAERVQLELAIAGSRGVIEAAGPENVACSHEDEVSA